MMPIELLTNLPGEILSGSQRWRPGWFWDMNYFFFFLPASVCVVQISFAESLQPLPCEKATCIKRIACHIRNEIWSWVYGPGTWTRVHEWKCVVDLLLWKKGESYWYSYRCSHNCCKNAAVSSNFNSSCVCTPSSHSLLTLWRSSKQFHCCWWNLSGDIPVSALVLGGIFELTVTVLVLLNIFLPHLHVKVCTEVYTPFTVGPTCFCPVPREIFGSFFM